jgi:hypothetical protein
MNIVELIGDWLSETAIVEQALRRSDAETKITNESYQIIEHLIKLFKWEDPINSNKHCNDITSWLGAVYRIKMKNGYPKQANYYQWMFSDIVYDVSDLTDIVSSMTRYHSLRVIRTDAEVYVLIDQLLDQISKDFATRQFHELSYYL